jgi:hypothetical protein
MKIPDYASFRSKTAAILALMAMLIAPLCGPVCSAGACESGNPLGAPRNENCHDSLAAGEDAPPTIIAAVRVCGSPDLPAAALSTGTSYSQEQRKLRSSTFQIYSTSLPVTARTLFDAPLALCHGTSEPAGRYFLPSVSILRI